MFQGGISPSRATEFDMGSSYNLPTSGCHLSRAFGSCASVFFGISSFTYAPESSATSRRTSELYCTTTPLPKAPQNVIKSGSIVPTRHAVKARLQPVSVPQTQASAVGGKGSASALPSGNPSTYPGRRPFTTRHWLDIMAKI